MGFVLAAVILAVAICGFMAECLFRQLNNYTFRGGESREGNGCLGKLFAEDRHGLYRVGIPTQEGIKLFALGHLASFSCMEKRS